MSEPKLRNPELRHDPTALHPIASDGRMSVRPSRRLLLPALNELDEAMLRGGEYDAGRQRRIASLRRNLTAARSDEERVRALLDLQQVFVTYELD